MLLAALALSQATPNPGQTGAAPAPARSPRGFRNMTPAQRAAAVANFLGLGPPPDKAAAALGAPIFEQNCSFCHGVHARGADAPDLIVAARVLNDTDGKQLVPFLKKGIPGMGMPSFASMSDTQLYDIAEFLHQEVYDVANRGTYHVLNIVVGNASEGKAYVASHCMTCHTPDTFDHFASKFRSPAELQRAWVWPADMGGNKFAITATVKLPDGGSISGRVTQISDFKVTLVDSLGQTHVINREPGVVVQEHNPLAAHQALITTLKNRDLHNVTAYLETLK